MTGAVTATALRTYPDTYVDSVLLMEATRQMGGSAGTEWAAAVMGTPANVAELGEAGFRLPPTRANDLVLAVRAASQPQADAALETGHAAVTARPQSGAGPAGPGAPARPGSLEEARAILADANVAIVSVPGPYAALEAHKALSAGLDVLLFSDNVSVADEIELKARAVAAGRLLMGPGAGTAMLGGTGLGFANALRRGRVGVVAAAGTGAQEVMTLLDRWGEGVSQAIGVGGRDLSAAVGGTMTRFALSLLADDPQTEAILLVSKPPSPGVAAGLLSAALGKPLTAALIGLATPIGLPAGVALAGTLDEAVIAALAGLGRRVEDPGRGLAELAAAGAAGLDPARTTVMGLFSGGTLCYESMVVMSRRLGPIRSNVPLDPSWGLPAPAAAHVCLDLGEEEYTQGRPHPMIDPAPRADQLLGAASNPTVAVLLVDVVLGYGSHRDPASVLAPACRQIAARGGGPVVVAHVLGTESDPQVRSEQCRLLAESGCLVAPTGARAALLAAAIASRQPAMAEERP